MNRLLLEGGPRGGAHDLFVDKVRAYGDIASVPGKRDMINGDGLNVHPEYLRLACFDALEAAGCHYRLYSPVTGVVMDGDAVTGVICTYKGRQHTFTAKVVVDATGDGDVAYFAGAEMVEGREEDGRHMPVSLVFALANVDTERFFAFLKADRERYKAILDEAADAGYAIAAWYSFDRTTIPGVVNVNNGAWRDVGNIDATQPGELTVAERAGIQVAVDFVRLARESRFPAWRSATWRAPARTSACAIRGASSASTCSPWRTRAPARSSRTPSPASTGPSTPTSSSSARCTPALAIPIAACCPPTSRTCSSPGGVARRRSSGTRRARVWAI